MGGELDSDFIKSCFLNRIGKENRDLAPGQFKRLR